MSLIYPEEPRRRFAPAPLTISRPSTAAEDDG